MKMCGRRQMNSLTLFYLLILLVMCGHVIFGREGALNYSDSEIECVTRVRYFANAAGVVS